MDKYCIYKNPNGELEVWEYIDDIEEANKYWYVKQFLDKYGIEDNLPICMNKLGGFHPCDKSRMIAIIESDHFPNIVENKDLFSHQINNPDFNYGWIDQEGNTYSCRYMQHTSLASDFCRYLYSESYSKWRIGNIDIPDDFLISMGWIKVDRDGEVFKYEKVSVKALDKLEQCRIKRRN